MNYRYIIDAYAWVEYFRASKYGEVAQKYIEGDNSATPTVVVSEVSRYLQREIETGNETQDGRLKRLEFMQTMSQIVVLNFEIAVKAGEVDVAMKNLIRGWGLADSIILCTARILGGHVVTGDEHFKGLEETIFIKTT